MTRHQRIYLRCAGVIFLITGVAKLISAFGVSAIHSLPDPIFGITFGKLMLVAGIVECFLAIMCIFFQGIYIVGAVTAFSTFLFLYRLGLWWIDWRSPCRCLGELTDLIHVHAQIADDVLRLVLLFLIAGGYLCLIGDWCQKKQAISFPEK